VQNQRDYRIEFDVLVTYCPGMVKYWAVTAEWDNESGAGSP
jgi:hypothetical protein